MLYCLNLFCQDADKFVRLYCQPSPAKTVHAAPNQSLSRLEVLVQWVSNKHTVAVEWCMAFASVQQLLLLSSLTSASCATRAEAVG
jgi:hypothetical protein